jgi:hypothetical protein
MRTLKPFRPAKPAEVEAFEPRGFRPDGLRPHCYPSKTTFPRLEKWARGAHFLREDSKK